MLRKEDDIKIKCLRIQKERKQTRLKSNWNKEGRKRNKERRKARGAILRAGLVRRKRRRRRRRRRAEGGGARERTDKGESTKRANINATLQTADVAPITNLILPSQPSFPSTRSPQIEKERQGGHMPYSNLPHPVAFAAPHPRGGPNPRSLSPPHLFTLSFPPAPSPPGRR